MNQRRQNFNFGGVPQNSRGRGNRGRGMRQRDFERMQNFNDQRAGNNWAQQVEAEERAEAARERMRPRVDAQPKPTRSAVASNAKDDPIYDGDAAPSRPVTIQLGHNLDFSGLAVLMEEVYRQCESENPRMSRELPYCMFQHAIVEHLNAYLIHQQKLENADARFQMDMDPLQVINAKDFLIPKVIHNYISGIGKALTPAGEVVKVNLPTAGTPRERLEDLTSGSFGAVDVVTHNAYECYWSPYVSQKLIERTLDMNTAAQARRNYGDWSPFPVGQFPQNGVFNGNLLGYHRPQRLHTDAINVLNDCQFDEGDTISGRLCHSATCIERTSLTLARLRSVESCPAVYKQEENPAIFVSKMVTEAVDVRLTDVNARLGCPYAFGQSAANRATYFGYKRRRTVVAPGLCVLVNNEPIVGYLGTRNLNYEMEDDYGVLNQLRDRASLREINHVSVASDGMLQLSLSAWMVRHFKKKSTF